MNNLLPYDGELAWYPAFYPKKEADVLFDSLRQNLDWQQENIRIFGKSMQVPRLVCWYGDDGVRYKYSGIEHQALMWDEILIQIKENLENRLSCSFNGVLGNLYRDGRDSVGWHADNEISLGVRPLIASLSLGAARKFKLRHNYTKRIESIDLKHGDLIMMSGNVQACWQHCIPKQTSVKGIRVNLTFRKILS